MKFGASQKSRFATEIGTYSIVTSRENYDSQITATGEEADLLIKYFKEKNIHVGSVKNDPAKSKKKFKLFPFGKNVELNLVFPKLKKTELRLYISERSGYKPAAGDIWFLFVKNGSIWIGSMDEVRWRSENRLLIDDDDDDKYQNLISDSSKIKKSISPSKEVYRRDRSIAIKRLKKSNYKCDFDKTHVSFKSRFSNNQYMEAHHLIPMSFQKSTKISLDNITNIFCLCPNCHRAIHNADVKKTKAIVDRLLEKRPDVLRILNNSVDDIYNLYAIEDINS